MLLWRCGLAVDSSVDSGVSCMNIFSRMFLFSTFLLWGCGPEHDKGSELKKARTTAKLFDVMDYSPYRHGQAPGGAEPTLSEIREDLALIKQISPEIRIYGMGPVADNILLAAKELGLGVHLGAWLSYDGRAGMSTADLEDMSASMTPANREQINWLLAAVTKDSQKTLIKSLIVGSETQYRREMSDERLADHLRFVRASLKASGLASYEVTTAQIYADYSPTLVENVDYVLYHVHPLWEQVKVEEAAAAVIRSWKDLRSKLQVWDRQGHPGFATKPLVIGETGWATEGQAIGAAVPSEENQYRFLVDLQKQAQAYTQESGEVMSIMYFDAFDEDWKKDEGSVGNSWGLYDIQRQPKLALRKLLGLPEPKPVNPERPEVPSPSPVLPGTKLFGVEVSGGTMTFFVQKAKWADLHYRINGGAQQNIRMQAKGEVLSFELNGLRALDRVSYFFTYESDAVKDSPWTDATAQ